MIRLWGCHVKAAKGREKEFESAESGCRSTPPMVIASASRGCGMRSFCAAVAGVRKEGLF